MRETGSGQLRFPTPSQSEEYFDAEDLGARMSPWVKGFLALFFAVPGTVFTCAGFWEFQRALTFGRRDWTALGAALVGLLLLSAVVALFIWTPLARPLRALALTREGLYLRDGMGRVSYIRWDDVLWVELGRSDRNDIHGSQVTTYAFVTGRDEPRRRLQIYLLNGDRSWPLSSVENAPPAAAIVERAGLVRQPGPPRPWYARLYSEWVAWGRPGNAHEHAAPQQQTECKWCGATFPPGTTECPQCGRPVRSGAIPDGL